MHSTWPTTIHRNQGWRTKAKAPAVRAASGAAMAAWCVPVQAIPSHSASPGWMLKQYQPGGPRVGQDRPRPQSVPAGTMPVGRSRTTQLTGHPVAGAEGLGLVASHVPATDDGGPVEEFVGVLADGGLTLRR